MPAKNNPSEPFEAKELILTRTFNAPRELVFKAWIDPKQVTLWWGPHGFTNPVCKLDPRPGGAIHIDMRAPDGTIYPMSGSYQEVCEPERLVFTCDALDEEGKPLFAVRTEVTFTAKGAQTLLTLKATPSKLTPQAGQYLSGMEAGWTQSLERFATHLESGNAGVPSPTKTAS